MRKGSWLKMALIAFFFGGFFLLTVGYAALSSTLNIEGNVVIGNSPLIYISEIRNSAFINGGMEDFSPKYKGTELTVSGSLPNINSSIIYYIAVTNTTNDVYEFATIREHNRSNMDIIYEHTGFDVGQIIPPNSTVVIQMEMRYNNVMSSVPSNTHVGYVLEYIFRPYGSEEKWDYVDQHLTLDLEGHDPSSPNTWGSGSNVVNLINVNYDEENNCYQFNGNGYGRSTKAYLPEYADFTISIYLKTQSIPFNNTENQTIVSQADKSTGNGPFRIALLKNNQIPQPSFISALASNSASINDYFEIGVESATNYQLHLVRTNGYFYYYLDADLVNRTVMPTNRKISTDYLEIGRFNQSETAYFKGCIYSVRVYDYALNYEEVNRNYEADIFNYDRVHLEDPYRVVDHAIANSYTTSGDGLYSLANGDLEFRGDTARNYMEVDGAMYRISYFSNDSTDRTVTLISIANPANTVTMTSAIEVYGTGALDDPYVIA